MIYINYITLMRTCIINASNIFYIPALYHDYNTHTSITHKPIQLVSNYRIGISLIVNKLAAAAAAARTMATRGENCKDFIGSHRNNLSLAVKPC